MSYHDFLNEVENPKKRTSGHNYKYANMSEVMYAISPALDKFHYHIEHTTQYEYIGDKLYMGVLSCLVDKDQKIIKSNFIKTHLPTVREEIRGTNKQNQECVTIREYVDMQDKGSIETYCKRYNVQNICVLTPEDDDGKRVTHSTKNDYQEKTPKKEAQEFIDKKQSSNGKGPFVTDAQLKRLFAITKKHNVTGEQVSSYMKANYGIESSKQLDWIQYDNLCKAIENGEFN